MYESDHDDDFGIIEWVVVTNGKRWHDNIVSYIQWASLAFIHWLVEHQLYMYLLISDSPLL